METSSITFGNWIDSLMANPGVGAIIIDIDSPGGDVSGCKALADKIYSYRGHAKPIIAVVTGMMASAAYWIGSAATEIIASEDSLIGSIGVIVVHTEYSKMLEEQGIKPTILTSGKYKGEGNPYEPLTVEAKDDWQSKIDQYYLAFAKSVARHRGVSVVEVKNKYGQGRMFLAKEAKELGMIDRIATLESVVQKMKPKNSKGRAQAVLDVIKLN